MKKNKVLALVLAASLIVLSFSALSISASAVGGPCGENVTWSFDNQTKQLLISGSGAMANYSTDNFAPWSGYEVASIVIGNEVTTIGNYAFYSLNKLTAVSISTSVTSIGENAFRYCSVLRQITIPGNVKSIGNHAFGQCSSLKSITFNEGLETVGDYAFYYCGNLGNVIFPSTVKTVGADAFYYCRNLMKVSVPYGVTEIPNEMFKDCESLTQVILPASIKKIGNSAFSGCKSLKTVNFGGTEQEQALITVGTNNEKLTDLTWVTEQCDENGHTSIEKWYFDENEHWHICTVCGEIFGKEGHTDTDNDLCDICGAPYVSIKTYSLLGTVKSFGDAEENITLKIFAEGEDTALDEKTVKGNEAEYLFENLTVGNYILKVSKKNHIEREYQITVADETVSLDPQINLIGDINGDGITDKKDANILKKHISRASLLSGYQFDVANINGDDYADKKDANLIKKHINRSQLLY